jgi:hypothetical protein
VIDLRFVPITEWPGTPSRRENARFRTHYNDTLDKLETELRHLKARAIVVAAFYTREQIRNDGWPKANEKPSNPGVIVSFTTPTGALSFPCDRYWYMEHNLHAIALSLEALRAVDRYGVTKSAEQYRGWQQIAAPAAPAFSTKEEAARFIWRYSDGISGFTDPGKIIFDVDLRGSAYRQAARRLHPDAQTGNHELFVKLQQALSLLDGSAK